MRHTPSIFLDKVDCYVNENQLRNFCIQVLPEISAEKSYTIETSNENYHQYGVGGYLKVTTKISKDREILIFSVHYIEWETYSDDSMDFQTVKFNGTFLIKETPFSRTIFDLIKAFVQS
ncbi:MAG: hypothetical protein A2908_04515 [Candidatus Staskawiczbacteria bacterium RIFCSPLOWO2_01_FULL_38_12b]|uniref:Uncharacterized protein n=1 Tax=Candidatus Staskawiczbacteria bacterium RIFCSPLOWO2_01_FULL_38_12b TaxID=1802214 RepID=A0A1G2IDE0_9BACT|nr:MAG: hypothetical protein A2908_04515 [Candidatus Staskawiczbacteria bacterium RIFCSPLOWO2_01_FULL_38_12b]